MSRLYPAGPAGRLVLFIIFLTCAALLLSKPSKNGDFQEYALMTIALANHATPDIRLPDIDKARQLSPEAGFVALHDRLQAGIARGDPHPFPGFVRGADERYYAIHFFAYSALAAMPFKVIDRLGGKPLVAFQLVNLAALAILVLALFRFTGSSSRAMFGTLLFLLCGATLYSNWCSPEFFSACALLSGLLLMLAGRPYGAALLAGVAAMQNPPLVFLAVFGPLIRLCHIHAHERVTWQAAMRKVATRDTILAMILLVALAGAPLLFNQALFGVPSIIARLATDPSLISPARLLSYFFDLNQGAIVGFPLAMALLLVQLAAKDRLRWLPHTIAALLFSVAMAIPSLSTVNWNSGASGMMRYAFWGGMPLLYLALTWLHRVPRWPPGPLVILGAAVLLQAGTIKYARSYRHVEFSPAASLMLERFPALYAPEPEIFIERVLHEDGAAHADAVAVYPAADNPVKIVFNQGSRAAHSVLCGPGGRVAGRHDGVTYPGGWRYLDGPPVCAQGTPAIGPRPRQGARTNGVQPFASYDAGG